MSEPRDRAFEKLGDYDVIAPIAEGGMASVWLGRRTGRATAFAALKVIRAEHAWNKDFVAMFLDEAAIASRLDHPNIVAVQSFGGAPAEGVQPFLAMELLRGHTLLESFRAMHAHGKVLSPEVVAWIGARVADALHYAHELTDAAGVPLHIVHRDVNPANVFLTVEGIPKLIDFGLARARDRIASTAIGVVKGKLAYLAPEQARGQPADPRSDVFALGVTLWELSVDRRLFLDESDVRTVRRVLEADVPDPRTIDANYPSELAQILLRALARDPEQRWPSAAALREGLDAFARTGKPDIGPATLRAILTEAFAGSPKATWESLVDDAVTDNTATRVWTNAESTVNPAHPTPLRTEPLATIPVASRSGRASSTMTSLKVPRSPWLVLTAVGAAGAILSALFVRGCGGREDKPDVERRLARLEDLLGLRDAGGDAVPSAPVFAGSSAAVSADEPIPSCAEAKVAAYRAWHDALAKAKTNAQPAEASCAGIWNDSKKQACYGAAMAPIRATQAARDSVIGGGAPARDAVRGVKDDTKNEFIARARAASVEAFDVCGEDAGIASVSPVL